MPKFLLALATAIALGASNAPLAAQQPVDGNTKEELKRTDSEFPGR